MLADDHHPAARLDPVDTHHVPSLGEHLDAAELAWRRRRDRGQLIAALRRHFDRDLQAQRRRREHTDRTGSRVLVDRALRNERGLLALTVQDVHRDEHSGHQQFRRSCHVDLQLGAERAGFDERRHPETSAGSPVSGRLSERISVVWSDLDRVTASPA